MHMKWHTSDELTKKSFIRAGEERVDVERALLRCVLRREGGIILPMDTGCY